MPASRRASLLALIVPLVAACGSDTQPASAPSGTTTASSAIAVTSLSLNPAVVSGGQTTEAAVEISAAAPAGGTTVTLSSSDATATVPSSVLVPQDVRTWRVPVQTRPVTSDVSVTLTAAAGGSTRTAVLRISPLPLPKVDSLVFNPAIVEGGQPSTGTLRLDRLPLAAPAVVTLSSDDPTVSVPGSIEIPVGGATATFTATTRQVSSSVVPRVTATAGGQSIAAPLTLLPRAQPTIPTSFSYTSAAGDYIGAGRSATWTSSNAEFLATAHCGGEHLDVRVATRPSNGVWSITVVAPQGGRLTAGTSLSNVQNQTVATPLPGFYVFGEGRACNKSYSSFQIHEASFLAGSVSRFRMTFEQRCEDPNAPPLRGELSLNDVAMFAYEVRSVCN